MSLIPPIPSQDKTFTHSWIKWFVVIKDFLEDLLNRITTVETAVTNMSSIASIQTGYVSTAGTIGSGEDAAYIDVSITAVSAIDKCVVTIQPQLNSGLPAMYTGRLMSTTVLRVTGQSASVKGRWYVVEYK